MARGINNHEIIGNLGQDPETRYTADGKAVTSFSVATSETWTKDGERQERTDWHNVVCFGKLAEICGEYLKKGAKVRVAGPNRTDSYDKDGVTMYRAQIHARDVLFLDKLEASPDAQGEDE